MRNTIIGLTAAAALIGALFAVSRLFPGIPVRPQSAATSTAPTPEQTAAAAASVGPGFVGSKNIGQWSLICPAQASAEAEGNVQPAASDVVKFVRCRASLLVHDRKHPKAVVLGAVARLLDGVDDLALILHTPPVAKAGVKVIVALAEKEIIGVPVISCDKKQCIAMGVLKSSVYNELVARPRLAVVIPISATGQRMIIPLSTKGLRQSIDAMKRAG